VTEPGTHTLTGDGKCKGKKKKGQGVPAFADDNRREEVDRLKKKKSAKLNSSGSHEKTSYDSGKGTRNCEKKEKKNT